MDGDSLIRAFGGSLRWLSWVELWRRSVGIVGGFSAFRSTRDSINVLAW